MYKWFACFKSGKKETGGDFRSNHPAVELCSILDDSAENISKIDSPVHTDTGYENV